MASEVGALYAAIKLDSSKAFTDLKSFFSQAGTLSRAAGIQTGTQFGMGFANGVKGGMNGAKSAVVSTDKAIEADVKKTTSKVSASWKSAGEQIKSNLGNSVTQTLSGLGAARSGNVFYAAAAGARGLQAAFAGVSLSAGGIAIGVAGVTAAIVAATAATAAWVGGLYALGKAGVTAGINMETLRTQFASLLSQGDSFAAGMRRAADEIQFIQDIAIESPKTFEEVATAVRTLMSQGFGGPEMTSMRRGLTEFLVNFGSAANLNEQTLSNLALAFGQIQSIGRLQGQEARQLSNSYIDVNRVLRLIPGYAKAGGAELKKAMEEGKISSQQFFTAMFLFAEQYKTAATKAANTTAGLWSQITDNVQLGLANAFDDPAVLDPIKNVLRGVLDVIDTINFDKLARSFGAAFRIITKAIGDVSGGAKGLTNFFNNTLPKGIRITAKVLGGLISLIRFFIRIGQQTWKTYVQAFNIISRELRGTSGDAFDWGQVLKWVGKIILSLVTYWGFTVKVIARLIGSLIRIFKGFANYVIGVAKMIAAILTGNWEALGNAWDQTWRGALNFFAGFANGALGIAQEMAQGIANIFGGLGQGIADMFGQWQSNINTMAGYTSGFADGYVPGTSAQQRFNERANRGVVGPKAVDLDTSVPKITIPSVGGVGAGDIGGGSGGSGGAGSSKTSDKIERINDALKALRALLNKKWKSKSDFAAAMSDNAGAIKDMVIQVSQLLRQAGKDNLVKVLKRQGEQLLKLVKREQEVSRKLERAQAALQKQLDARNTWIKDFTKSMRDYAFALEGLADGVTKVTIGAFGQFVELATASPAQLIKNLEARQKAILDFYKNLRKLRKMGLNDSLIKQLAEAGVEGGGELASALVGASAKEIKKINQTTSEVNKETKKFANRLGKEFYRAGIQAARGMVDGLESQLNKIGRQMERIVNHLVKTLKKALKISSPSRVMYELGEYTTEGFIQGLSAKRPAMDVGGLASGMKSIGGGHGLDGMQVRVYIGNEELTGYIRTEIAHSDASQAEVLYAGRRV